MAKFEEEKVINALHPEKAEIGKKYYFADDLIALRDKVEARKGARGTLEKIAASSTPFWKGDSSWWKFIYPCEEPPKERMTHLMLTEWCAKGNGQFKYDMKGSVSIHVVHEYSEDKENEEVTNDIFIRSFGQTEWIEPTVDIYERDCKGGK